MTENKEVPTLELVEDSLDCHGSIITLILQSLESTDERIDGLISAKHYINQCRKAIRAVIKSAPCGGDK